MVTTPSIVDVFGPDAPSGIGQLVQAFDFSNIDIKDSDKDDFLHIDLAPSFGTLDSEGVKALDDEVKVMIAGTMRALQAKRKAGPLLWDVVMSTLMQNSLLVPGDGEIDRADKLVQSGGDASKAHAAGAASASHKKAAPASTTLMQNSLLEPGDCEIDRADKLVQSGGKTMCAFQPKRKADPLRRDDVVMSTPMQHSLLEPGDGEIDRADKLVQSGGNASKPDAAGAAAASNMNVEVGRRPSSTTSADEVNAWFGKLVADRDILAETNINIDVFTAIVARIKATGFPSLFGSHEIREKTLVDIAVLRFPEISKPYLKAYRIKLTAWSSTGFTWPQAGITGEFKARNFHPRSSIINTLKEETKMKAIGEAEALFV